MIGDDSAAPSIASLLRNNRYSAVTSAAFLLQPVFLRSASGSERLGEPFTMSVKLVADRLLEFDKIVGRSMTIGLKIQDGRTRYFNGIVTSFEYRGLEGSKRPSYVAELRPWLVLLEYRRNFRIFQNKTSKQIIASVFADHKESNFRDETLTPKPLRRYCVQYDETDFAFVSRLMEQDGIYYYFEHSETNHELVLVDDAVYHKSCNPEVVDTRLKVVDTRLSNWSLCEDVFWKWTERATLQPSQVALRDYDFQKPSAQMTARALTPHARTGGVPTLSWDEGVPEGGRGGSVAGAVGAAAASASREILQFPGRFSELEDGERYARIRAEELACQAYGVTIEGGARQVTAGLLFKAANPFDIANVELAPQPDQLFLATAVEYTIVGEVEDNGLDPDQHAYFYKCKVEALPAVTQYRSPQRTPIPSVAGLQTAMVVGQPGETITTDQYGRIKVQFLWDRYGTNDESSSCFVRVAQAWAGKNYGCLTVPRVGQEVVVDFLYGNPDCPMVIGAVYNATNMPPEDLPARATRSTFKTRSVGEALGAYNQLRFEDRAGAEQVYLRAQKDCNVDVGETYRIRVRQKYSLTTPSAFMPSGAVPTAGPFSSHIEVTPERISFVLTTPTGPQTLQLGPEGISLIGTSISLLATEGLITAIPFPVPVETPELDAAVGDAVEAEVEAIVDEVYVGD